MDILHTLQTLNACHGPSGDEREIADAHPETGRPLCGRVQHRRDGEFDLP